MAMIAITTNNSISVKASLSCDASTIMRFIPPGVGFRSTRMAGPWPAIETQVVYIRIGIGLTEKQA